MKLSQEDADLFFKLMWGLQFYVNQQRHILPEIKSVEAYAALSMSDKIEVRDALWEHPDLIDAYLAQNPDGLSVQEVELVRKWKRFVAGTFQIFRFLKKHTIFIGEVVDAGVATPIEGRPDDATLTLKDLGDSTFYGG